MRANLKRYRAAVLKAAVEGKLTEDWRAQHPDTEPASVLLERILTERRRQWEKDQLAKFAQAGKQPPKGWQTSIVTCGPDDGAHFSASLRVHGISVKAIAFTAGVPALRLTAMNDAGFDYAERRYIPINEEIATKLSVKEGDFFVARGNGSLHLVGRGTLAQSPPEQIVFPDIMIRLRFVPIVPTLNRFVALMWQTRFVRRRRSKQEQERQAGIFKISNETSDDVPSLPLPPVNEQSLLMSLLRAPLDLDQIETQVEANLKRAARLRQGILKRAFEGRLLPQDPTDEPAEKLLERIRQQRQPATTMYNGRMGTRRARRPRRTSDPVLPFPQDDGSGQGGKP